MTGKQSSIEMRKPRFRGFTDHYKKRLYAYLLTKIPKLTEKEKHLIRKAYVTAYNAHYGVVRKGGNREAYISHPVEVAIIIADEMGFGPTSIAAALLHDVVEDSDDYSAETITELFNNDISLIVAGVTKITDHGNERNNVDINDITAQKEYFTNMLKLIPEDYRVLLTKAADRLHNMRTMQDMPENSKRIKSSENLYIYSRLAGMAGLWNIKKELEDRSFMYLYPKEYNEITSIKKRYEPTIKNKIAKLNNKLKDFINSDYDIEIQTTSRSLYSVWEKMKKHKTSFVNIHNFHSTRIIIDINNKDKKKEKLVKRKVAHNLYLQITNRYHEKDRSLRDWILTPRNNGFSALVFDVMFNGEWREIQILSKKDEVIADKGWLDKDNAPGLINLQKQIREDLSQIIDTFEGRKSAETYHFFTPKGDLIELPKGATVLDFAYSIHTDLGSHCIGAIIDGHERKVSRSHILNNTDIVQIITDERVTPKPVWLENIVTARAKIAIKTYLRKEKIVFEKEKHTDSTSEYKISRRKPFEINETIKFTLAGCCKPVFGDKAMIYKRKDGKLIVHHENCRRAIPLRATNSDDTTTVIWGEFPADRTYLTKIELEGKDTPGILHEIITVISSKMNLNMNNFFLQKENDFFTGYLEFFVHNNTKIDMVIDELQKINGILTVYRKFD